jgi:microcystin-dependent protein
MPVHTHRLNASADSGLASVQRPTDAVDVWSQPFNGNLYSTAAPATAMSSSMVGVAGGSQPHTNLQPYLTVNFCIAMQGIFPPR